MSMTKSIADFLNNLAKSKDLDCGEYGAISSQVHKAILLFVKENYGAEAYTYIASCFDDQHEDPEGDPAPESERYVCHTLPGEALMDWIHRPTPTNPNGFNRG